MGLVKALQGAPESFKGYTGALAKKEERDFLSQQAELQHMRNVSMEKLRAGNQRSLAEFNQGALDERQAASLASAEKMQQAGFKHDFELNTEKYASEYKLMEDKIKLAAQTEEDQKNTRLDFFEKQGMEKSLLSMGLPQGNVDIIKYSAAEGKDITPLLTSFSAAIAKKGLSQEDRAKMYEGLLDKYTDVVAGMDEDARDNLQAKYGDKYPDLTSLEEILTTQAIEALTGAGVFQAAQGLMELNDPAQINNTAMGIKRMLRDQTLKSTTEANAHIDANFGPKTAEKLKKAIKSPKTAMEGGPPVELEPGQEMVLDVGTGKMKPARTLGSMWRFGVEQNKLDND